MENPYNEEKINLIREDSEKIRGRILETTITVEFLISKILVEYFAEESKKNDFFRYIVSDKITFDTKKYILASLKKEGKIPADTFYKELIGDLEYIQIIRNLVAHTILYLDPNYVNSYSRKKTTLNYTGTKNYGKQIIIYHEDVEEDLKNLIYSFPKITNTINRIISGLENCVAEK
jgi:hypothetical protein